jgi:prolyl-tRNA synthetase
VGTREVEESAVTITCRINGVSETLSRTSKVAEKTEKMLVKMQAKMYGNTKAFLKDNTTRVKSFDEFKKVMNDKKGFIKAYWCGAKECEAKIKEETKATTRVKVSGNKSKSEKCIYCSKKLGALWYFAQAY